MPPVELGCSVCTAGLFCHAPRTRQEDTARPGSLSQSNWRSSFQVPILPLVDGYTIARRRLLRTLYTRSACILTSNTSTLLSTLLTLIHRRRTARLLSKTLGDLNKRAHTEAGALGRGVAVGLAKVARGASNVEVAPVALLAGELLELGSSATFDMKLAASARVASSRV